MRREDEAVVFANRVRDRCQSLAVVWGELINQLGHANPALDRRIVLEGQLRSPLHAQLACEPGLQD